jgi:hypothetical protein
MAIDLPKEIIPQPLTRVQDHSQPTGLILTNEAGLRKKNPRWQLVEQVVRELDMGSGNSFCGLERPGDSYVQTLHGFNEYHLEWRINLDALQGYTHYRACYPGASPKGIELKKHDCTNSGEHRDLVHIDEVIDAFRAFYRGEGMPGWLDWRVLDI